MSRPIRAASAVVTSQQRLETPAATLGEQLDARRRLVDDGVADFLDRHYHAAIRDITGYIALGGKRLRGILAVIMCEALNGLASDALPAAVAVELAHAASLAHDDIIDADVVRRRQPALHVRYDLATAILVPHLIVPQAILSAGIYGPQAIRTILEGWTRVARGQVSDSVPVGFGNGVDRSGQADGGFDGAESEYLGIIRDKTAALFETAAELGAVAARDDRNVTVAREYAAWLGSAFQIADDVTDLERYADQPWSALLGDHGARSLDALRRMVAGADEERITPSAIDGAGRLAAQHVARCLECVAMFPASPLRELLSALPAVAVEQIYREAQGATHQASSPCAISQGGA